MLTLLSRADSHVGRSLCLRHILLCCWVFASSPVPAAESDVPTAWSNFSYVNYTYLSSTVADFEGSSDPSNGGAAVSPSTLDISSCSADGTAPGVDSSTRIAYYDADGSTATLGDAWMSFGIRIDADPLNGGKQEGYVNNHWNILLDIDNDGFKEFVIDVDGKESGSKPDRFYLRHNDSATQAIDPATDTLDKWYASGPGATGAASTNNHTRVTPVTIAGCGTDYWLDVQIPLTAFNVGGTQLISPDTPVRMFYSTSASNTNPLQKDWMMDPAGLGGSGYIVTTPIVFGDIYSGTGGVTPATSVVISEVWLETVQAADFLAGLGHDSTDTVQLLGLLEVWNPGLAADMASADSYALVDALLDHLDPDGDGQVALLAWQTLEERGTIGFHAERQDDRGGWWRINKQLLPGLIMAPMGGQYILADPDARSGNVYHYRLVELEADGNTRAYGPFTLQMLPLTEP